MRSFLPITALLSGASAAVVNYDWTLSWKLVSPDGFPKPVISVNNQWPPPTIEATVGDHINMTVKNNLGNETAAIHFHGMYQQGTPWMDGPVNVTQCPIAPGYTFNYYFQVLNQTGTYWWHSHVGGQIADGLLGPMIIKDPSPPYAKQVTGGEITVTLSDWYHDSGPKLISCYQSLGNEQNGHNGAEPLPFSGLMNDGQDTKFNVQPGKTYLMRFINPGTFVGSYVEIKGHNLTIVEADGIYVEPFQVDKLYLSVGQRYAVLLTTKSDASTNYLIEAQLDTSMFDDSAVIDNPNTVPNYYGYLIYNGYAGLPAKEKTNFTSSFDDLDLVTSTANKGIDIETYTKVDRTIILNVNFNKVNGLTTATWNKTMTYNSPLVPTLYTALDAPAKDVWNPKIYGDTTPILVKHGEVIQIIINNQDSGTHPIHMHGRTFQVINRNSSKPDGSDNFYKPGAPINPPHPRPLRRDTISINPSAALAIRFKADTPGVHLLHCHIDWHVEAGFSATIIEAPDIMQATMRNKIPLNHLNACRALGAPSTGNAGGSTDYTNYKDVPRVHSHCPTGAVVAGQRSKFCPQQCAPAQMLTYFPPMGPDQVYQGGNDTYAAPVPLDQIALDGNPS